MWKKIRVLILLLILLFVTVNAWRDQHQDWSKPIMVLLHPVNADGQPETQHYIEHLSAADFEQATQYLQQSAQQFYHQPVYFYLNLGRELKQLPPQVPAEGGVLNVMLWSLKFRFYAWKQQQDQDDHPTVTLYLNYYDPQNHNILKHSTALQRGRIGSVNLFASVKQSEQNQIVLVHELLHAFGATDKYDLATGLPVYPQGFVQPQKQPLYPQQQAEIMAGQIPLSEQHSRMPDSLQQTLVGELTAAEIGWR